MFAYSSAETAEFVRLLFKRFTPKIKGYPHRLAPTLDEYVKIEIPYLKSCFSRFYVLEFIPSLSAHHIFVVQYSAFFEGLPLRKVYLNGIYFSALFCPVHKYSLQNT